MFMNVWNNHKKFVLAMLTVVILCVAVVVGVMAPGKQESVKQNQKTEKETSEESHGGLEVEETIDDNTVDRVEAPENWGEQEGSANVSDTKDDTQENGEETEKETDNGEEDILKDDKVWSMPR